MLIQDKKQLLNSHNHAVASSCWKSCCLFITQDERKSAKSWITAYIQLLLQTRENLRSNFSTSNFWILLENIQSGDAMLYMDFVESFLRHHTWSWARLQKAHSINAFCAIAHACFLIWRDPVNIMKSTNFRLKFIADRHIFYNYFLFSTYRRLVSSDQTLKRCQLDETASTIAVWKWYGKMKISQATSRSKTDWSWCSALSKSLS